MRLVLLPVVLLLVLALPGLAFGEGEYTLIGAGVRTRPDFDGSRGRTVDAVPVLRFYGERWFARTTQGILEGGPRWSPRPDLEVGAQIAYEAGPRDEDPGASIGLHAEADRNLGPVPVNALVRVRRHLDGDRGTEVDGRVTIGVYGNRGILAGLFAQATWATEKKFESYYGIADTGLLFTSVGALASYEITQRWMVVGSLERRRLSNDAARSPIVEKQTGVYASAGLGYRF